MNSPLGGLLKRPKAVSKAGGYVPVPAGPPPEEGTIAFVPPRFGEGVVGGAEAVLAEAAAGLAARGHRVEILTSCARDHYTWANELPAGVREEDGITVRRFPTQTDTAGVHRDRIGARILGGDGVTLAEQQLWVNDSLRVSGLWHHVLDHASRYRALVFAPYMFWTTYAVGQIAPGRTILMPCLHDEPTARLDIFRPLMGGSRGVWFLTDPEAELADHLFELPARRAVIGSGIDIPGSYRPSQFRQEHGIEAPFIYYAGRREWGKGWSDLLHAYGELIRSHPTNLLLVTSGVGAVDAPPDIARRVIDLGFVTDEQRNDAMAAAAAYVQPSAMESFSRTVLEAWCAGTPVVANAASAVVRWHVERSGAGLVYHSPAELVQALRFVADQPEAARNLARPGRAYVEANYQWPAVLDRMEATLDAWLPLPGTEPKPWPDDLPRSTPAWGTYRAARKAASDAGDAEPAASPAAAPKARRTRARAATTATGDGTPAPAGTEAKPSRKATTRTRKAADRPAATPPAPGSAATDGPTASAAAVPEARAATTIDITDTAAGSLFPVEPAPGREETTR